MFKRKLVSTALFGLLFVSPFAMAVDEHHPENAAEVTQEASGQEAPGDASVAPSGMMKPGMMPMTQGGGMMGKMMMGGQKGGGGMMQGGSGMMGQGGMMSHGMKGGHYKGMMRKHQQVVNRLDMLDARMAKIEVMLERLMQR